MNRGDQLYAGATQNEAEAYKYASNAEFWKIALNVLREEVDEFVDRPWMYRAQERAIQKKIRRNTRKSRHFLILHNRYMRKYSLILKLEGWA